MSTAVLISGQMRTLAQCFPTQRWHVFRHFPDLHFFITVQDSPDCQAIDLLTAEYGADRVHADVRTDPRVVDLSDGRMHGVDVAVTTLFITPEIERAYNFAPYANAAPAAQLLMQHWYQNEVWKFFKTLTAENADGTEKTISDSASSAPPAVKRFEDFDTIIRIRPDLWFHSFESPLEEIVTRWGQNYVPTGSVKCIRNTYADEAFTPWWGRFGGVNDRLAILGRDAALAYFTVYEHLPELLDYGCPFHPESLVYAALERANIRLHQTLQTEFTTLRAAGNHRPPEIMPWDIAHAALRAA